MPTRLMPARMLSKTLSGMEFILSYFPVPRKRPNCFFTQKLTIYIVLFTLCCYYNRFIFCLQSTQKFRNRVSQQSQGNRLKPCLARDSVLFHLSARRRTCLHAALFFHPSCRAMQSYLTTNCPALVPIPSHNMENRPKLSELSLILPANFQAYIQHNLHIVQSCIPPSYQICPIPEIKQQK